MLLLFGLVSCRNGMETTRNGMEASSTSISGDWGSGWTLSLTTTYQPGPHVHMYTQYIVYMYYCAFTN